jgi:hypothetical protein
MRLVWAAGALRLTRKPPPPKKNSKYNACYRKLIHSKLGALPLKTPPYLKFRLGAVAHYSNRR